MNDTTEFFLDRCCLIDCPNMTYQHHDYTFATERGGGGIYRKLVWF